MPCSNSRKYWIFCPQQWDSRSLTSHTSLFTKGSTRLLLLSPFLARSCLSRKPSSPYLSMPFIQISIVSRCLPNLSAMRVFGILCSCSSQHKVISVLSCMSMILHGLSDFYGNIAPQLGYKGSFLDEAAWRAPKSDHSYQRVPRFMQMGVARDACARIG